jgi:hypothetical protein
MPVHTECRADFDADAAVRAACGRARAAAEHLQRQDGPFTRKALRVALSDAAAWLSNGLNEGPAGQRQCVLKAFLAAEDACSYTGPTHPALWTFVTDIRDTIAVLYARLCLEAGHAR